MSIFICFIYYIIQLIAIFAKSSICFNPLIYILTNSHIHCDGSRFRKKIFKSIGLYSINYIHEKYSSSFLFFSFRKYFIKRKNWSITSTSIINSLIKKKKGRNWKIIYRFNLLNLFNSCFDNINKKKNIMTYLHFS
jgi:hypothetical protein